MHPEVVHIGTHSVIEREAMIGMLAVRPPLDCLGEIPDIGRPLAGSMGNEHGQEVRIGAVPACSMKLLPKPVLGILEGVDVGLLPRTVAELCDEIVAPTIPILR